MSETINNAATPNGDPGTNPYVGPRTFTRDQAHLFFGREREAEELFSRVVSQRLVLFYAQSGAGKSSLINTQLIPKLEATGFVVLPVGRVGGDLLGGVDDTVDNIYLFNLMLSLDQSQRDPARLAHLTLPHFLERLTTEDGVTWFYDEADEGLTGGQDDWMTGRAEVSPTDTPLTIDNSQFTINNSPPSSPNYVLIIDQFEEIITTHGDRWQNRAEFFRQLEAAMVDDPALWVVLTLREDFVAALDPYAPLLSDNLRARYYMQRMGVEAARLAISQPVAHTRPFQLAAVDLLVNNLSQVRVAGKASTESGQYIEPVQLQVVCYQLWEGLQDRSTAEISVADVEMAGDVDSALASFYEATLAAALHASPLVGGERRLRRWFEEKLLTEAGTRGTVYQGEQETAGLPNALVLELANRFLLRSEARSGGRWVELTHDRFAEPIVTANRVWEAKQNNPLTIVTRLWLENGRDLARLLSGVQLRDAEHYAQEHAHELGNAEREFLAASLRQRGIETAAKRQRELELAQADAEKERQSANRLRYFVRSLIALALFALLAAGWAFQQSRVAVTAKATAEAASLLAQQNANTAATAEAQANLDAGAARQAQATAEAARAETQRLQEQIQADRMAQIAALTNIDKNLAQYPQRALLLAVEAAQMITPPVPSTLTTLHDLLGRTGGAGFSGLDYTAFSLAFSPDGKMLASGSGDETIRVWLLKDLSGDPVVLKGHVGGVTSVAFSPDGKMLASGSGDETIRVWSLTEPQRSPVVFTGHVGSVTSVAFSPDGKVLASGSEDKTIRIWSLMEPRRDPVVLIGHADFVHSVAFSPDGKVLASGSGDATILLWSLTELSHDPIVLKGHTGGITSVAFSPDGKTLASGSGDATIRLWSLTEPSRDPIVLNGHAGGITSVAFSPDGKTLASGSRDKTIRVWSLMEPNRDPIVLIGHEDAVYSVAFSTDSEMLVSGSGDETIRIWSPAEPTHDPLILTGHGYDIVGVVFSPDGKTLASGSGDETIRIWSLEEPSLDPIVLMGDDYISSIAFSPDGKTLASSSWDKTIRLWSLAEPSRAPIVITSGDYIHSIAFSSNGETLASGGQDKTIRLWSLVQPSRAPILLTGHEDAVHSVAFSPDGKMLASGSEDKTIRLWSVAEPNRDPIVLTDHASSILSVAFSPDGKMLASGSGDATIRLWLLGQLSGVPTILSGHVGAVSSLSFSPDGEMLASGSWDRTIRLWIMLPKDLLALACKVAGRNLSVKEWQAAFGEMVYRRTCPQWPAGK